MNPAVSIIIPCYNAGAWIGAAIESALAQDGIAPDVIVINDGSTDQSLAIARGYEPQGVRVLDQPNRGAAAARNAGLRAARGAYLQYLDADDLLGSGKILRQLERLQSAPPETIAAGSWGIFHERESDARFTAEPAWCDAQPVDWLVCSWQGGGMMHPAAWLVPRVVADRSGPWNEALTLDDDGEYFSRVILASPGIVFVPDARSYYRAHGGARLSASAGIRAAESSFLSCTLKEQHLLTREDSPRTRGALAHNYSRFAWEQLEAAPELAERAIRRWRELDPTLAPPRAGRMHNLAAAIFGWRRARSWQLRRRR